MNINYYDLGRRTRGEIVEVTLRGNAVNVLLLDSSNFSAYKRGRGARYIGGQARRSPVRLQVPRDGHWYVVLDFGGLAGRVNAGVRVLPGALPPLRQRNQQLASIAEELAEAAPGPPAAKAYDVFICHATEDKEAVVRPLASALVDQGLSVWYDEFELTIGDSLRRSIDAGIVRSRFGLVVVSPAFFAKNWPQYELDGLVTREMSGKQMILPVWHKITHEEIVDQSPSLADKLALRTADLTVEQIAVEIAGVVGDAVDQAA